MQGNMEGHAITEGNNSKALLSFEIFSRVKVCQLQHGMRETDYERYRKFCKDKIRRTKKRIGFLNKRGKQYVKNQFSVDNVKDSNSLYIPLMNAERAWAYAMEMKERSQKSHNARTFTHIGNKLKRATQHAHQLQQICYQTGDDMTKIQSDAYYYHMKGNELMEKEDWKAALESYLLTRSVLDSLCNVGTTASRELFTSKVNELLPFIRYCEYNLKRTHGLTASDVLSAVSGQSGGSLSESLTQQIANLLRKQHTMNKEEMRMLEYRGYSMKISEDQVRLALLECKDMETALHRIPATEYDRSLSQYSSIFNSYDDCHRWTNNEKDKTAKANVARVNELSNLCTVLKYFKQRRVVERNVLLLKKFQQQLSEDSKTVSLSDLISLSSNIVDSLEDLNSLSSSIKTVSPSGSGSGSSSSHSDELASTLVSERVESLHLQYRAVRAMYGAQNFVSQKKFGFAFTLATFASQIVDELEKEANNDLIFDSKNESYIPLGQSLAQLRDQSSNLMATIKAQSIIDSYPTITPTESLNNQTINHSVIGQKKTLAQSMNEFTEIQPLESLKIIDIPTPMELTTCKPLFFDLMEDVFGNYPDVSNRCSASEQKQKKAGWFGGWW